MNEILNDIKNRVYEVEGLLELAQHRSDKLADLLPLMLARIESVRNMLADFKIENIAKKKEIEMPEECELHNEELPKDKEEEGVSDSTASQSKDIKSLFCLNDRFKFRRMIFGGSDADFNEAMDALGSLPTLAEAEDYFYNSLGLDPEMAEVQEFMAVIKNFYGK